MDLVTFSDFRQLGSLYLVDSTLFSPSVTEHFPQFPSHVLIRAEESCVSINGAPHIRFASLNVPELSIIYVQPLTFTSASDDSLSFYIKSPRGDIIFGYVPMRAVRRASGAIANTIVYKVIKN